MAIDAPLTNRLALSHLLKGSRMRHQYRTAMTVAATVSALAACGDPPTTTPIALSRGVTAVSLTLGCNINALKAGARDYSASNRDPLFTIIGDLQSLSKNGPNAAATNKAFDGLARLAAMRGTSAQSSSATGATFNALTTGFLGCMESSVTSTVPDGFNVAGALGAGWMYEVRGGQADGAAGAYERGQSPYWAAEAPQGWGVASQAKRFLIYGYRLPDFLANDPTVGSAFEISTIPTIASGALTLSSPLTIGLCHVELTSTLRVQHVSTILPERQLSCDAPPSFATLSTPNGFGALSPMRLARRAVAFLSPQPLQAAFIVGGVGGAVSELSPSVVIDMQSVQLAFAQAVSDGVISQPLADASGNALQVRVTTQNGSPLAGVTVTLGIAGNSSSIAFLQDGSAAASATVTRTTATNGLATFDNVFLTKAGGYTLVASGAFDGVAGAPILSSSFNMQNK